MFFSCCSAPLNIIPINIIPTMSSFNHGMTGIRKIFVVKFGNIGDVLLSEPLLENDMKPRVLLTASPNPLELERVGEIASACRSKPLVIETIRFRNPRPSPD